LLRLGDLGELLEASIGDRDLADIGLDRAERKIRRLRGGSAGQGIEERRLADIGRPTMPILRPMRCL